MRPLTEIGNAGGICFGDTGCKYIVVIGYLNDTVYVRIEYDIGHVGQSPSYYLLFSSSLSFLRAGESWSWSP